MNYVPWHFGDFNNATRHLTRVERSVYRDAIELYYDTEQPLNCVEFDYLAKRLLCQSDEEKQALRDVLREFFVKEGDLYRHERCDAEIAKYHSNTSAKARAGIASAAKRKQKSTGVEQVLDGCATNQEPRTKNQEPIKPSGLKRESAKAPRPQKPQKTALPTNFAISDRVKTWAIEKGHSQLERHLECFVGKATASGYVYADWDAAFMEAIRADWAKLNSQPIVMTRPQNQNSQDAVTARNHARAAEFLRETAYA